MRPRCAGFARTQPFLQSTLDAGFQFFRIDEVCVGKCASDGARRVAGMLLANLLMTPRITGLAVDRDADEARSNGEELGGVSLRRAARCAGRTSTAEALPSNSVNPETDNE